MDIDEALNALARSGEPPELAWINEGIRARIEADRHLRRQGRQVLAAAVGMATLAGVAGAALPTHRSAPSPNIVASVALAPSTLLGGGE